MSKIIITGASSGIGLALATALTVDHEVISLGISTPPINIRHKQCDVQSYSQVYGASRCVDKVDIIINNAGVNFIDWIESTPEHEWDRVMNTNAKGIFNMTKAFLPPLLESKGTILNIVSNASHMPMTNSIAYNASKGAAHIMTLQMARELGPKGITVFGISPNRVADTKMSEYIDNRVCGLRGWTPEYAREYQLKALPAGEETDPETLAEFVAFILSNKRRHKYMAGTILPYGK